MLTRQEKRVAELLVDGFTPLQISEIMNLTYGAVRHTLKRCYQEFGISKGFGSPKTVLAATVIEMQRNGEW